MQAPASTLATAYHEALARTLPGLAQSVVQEAFATIQSALQDPSSAEVANDLRLVLSTLARGDGAASTQSLLQAFWRQVQEGESGPAREDAVPTRRGSFELRLVDDDDIEEDIEASRVLQALEAAAPREMRALAAWSAEVDRIEGASACHPLRPERGLRAAAIAARDAGLMRGARQLWLHAVGDALIRQLKGVYTEQLRQLRHQGAEPLPLPPSMGLSAPVGDAAPGMDPVQALVARARASHPGPAAAPGSPEVPEDGVLPPLHLLDQPAQLGQGAGPGAAVPLDLAEADREELMGQLITHFIDQAAAAPRIRALLLRLVTPSRHSARRDPSLWHTREHALWQLLDRIATLGMLYARPDGDVPAEHPVLELLERVVGRIERLPAAGQADYANAVERIDRQGNFSIDETVAREQPQIHASALAARRLDFEPVVRRQIWRQLAAHAREVGPLPHAVSRFLLGPWVEVISSAMARQNDAAAPERQLTDAVDHLLTMASVHHLPPEIVAVRRAPALPRMLALIREGLGLLGWPQMQMSVQLAELTKVLRDPAAALAAEPADVEHPELHEPPPTETAPFHGSSALPARASTPGSDYAQHGILPTVPIDMLPGGGGPTRASADREAWLEGLRPGHVCRIFVAARWTTLRVAWRSDNGQVFMLSGRDGRQKSITRRALEKLRAAGLAATLSRGSLIDRAMATLPMALDDKPR